MLYDPLSHLSGLYAAAIDSQKSQRLYPELVQLGDSVLRCLGLAHQWDAAHSAMEKDKHLSELTKTYIKRIQKIHSQLNAWVDERQYANIIRGFEIRWQEILDAANPSTDETWSRLATESQYRFERLNKIIADIDKHDEQLRNRYAEPIAL